MKFRVHYSISGTPHSQDVETNSPDHARTIIREERRGCMVVFDKVKVRKS